MKQRETLDNAANLFAALANERDTTVFRLEAILETRISIDILDKAFKATIERYPYFNLYLRKGLFWYYFEPADVPPSVQQDSSTPCMHLFSKAENCLLYAIKYDKNKIIGEFSHILVDGEAGSTFFKALVQEYIRIHFKLPNNHKLLNPIQKTEYNEEFEDSYLKNYRAGSRKKHQKDKSAYQFNDPLLTEGKYLIETRKVSTNDLKLLAREYHLKITEFLTAVLIASIREHITDRKAVYHRKNRKSIQICIPLNLRRLYLSKTMRNFILSINCGLDLYDSKITFEEICNTVKAEIESKANIQNIDTLIKRNVSGAKNIFIHFVPRIIKNLILNFWYKRIGSGTITMVLSNVMRIKFDEATEEHIKSFIFIPNPPNKFDKIKCGVVGFKDDIYITFGKIVESTALENIFYQKLSEMGIQSTITNAATSD
jgi:hypothetical protein